VVARTVGRKKEQRGISGGLDMSGLAVKMLARVLRLVVSSSRAGSAKASARGMGSPES